MKGAIPIFDKNGKLWSNVSVVLAGYMTYPEDGESRQLLIDIGNFERDRFRSLGREEWEPCELSKSIFRGLDGGTQGKLIVTGLVALACLYISAKEEGKPTTVYAATKLVSKAIDNARKAARNETNDEAFLWSWRPIGGGEFSVRRFKLPRDRKGAEKAFREFQSVAHILAADILIAHKYGKRPTYFFEQSITQIWHFLITAGHMENFLEKAISKDSAAWFDDPWRVWWSLDDEAKKVGAVEFAPELINFFSAVYAPA